MAKHDAFILIGFVGTVGQFRKFLSAMVLGHPREERGTLRA